MYLAVELDRDADGRHIAEVPALRGVLAYDATWQEAVARAQALALRVLADRLEHGEPAPDLLPLDVGPPPWSLEVRPFWPAPARLDNATPGRRARRPAALAARRARLGHVPRAPRVPAGLLGRGDGARDGRRPRTGHAACSAGRRGVRAARRPA